MKNWKDFYLHPGSGFLKVMFPFRVQDTVAGEVRGGHSRTRSQAGRPADARKSEQQARGCYECEE